VFKTVSIGIQDFWFDRTPLNNANTTWSAPFHLLNVRLGYQKTIANDWEIGVYGGLNNLLNTKYTSNYNLNAAGDKYYNPSALQNWFVGLNVRYSLVR
jgi:iron complex outermembrane receptor protein